MLVKYLHGTICINSCLSQGDLFIHIHEMPFSLTNLKGYSAGGECNTYLKEKEREKNRILILNYSLNPFSKSCPEIEMWVNGTHLFRLAKFFLTQGSVGDGMCVHMKPNVFRKALFS